MEIKLSTKSIQDLKSALSKTFGQTFCESLSDDELQDLGSILLVVTAEHLKLKVANS